MSNPMVPTNFYWVMSCLPLRNFITQTFVTFQLPALLCYWSTCILGCFCWCLSSLRDSALAKALCAWWIRVQSLQLLTLLYYWSVSRLAFCHQLNVSWGFVSFVKVVSVEGLDFASRILRYSGYCGGVAKRRQYLATKIGSIWPIQNPKKLSDNFEHLPYFENVHNLITETFLF